MVCRNNRACHFHHVENAEFISGLLTTNYNLEKENDRMADLHKQLFADKADLTIENMRLARERDFLIDRISRCLEICAEDKHILPQRIKNILVRSIETVKAGKV
ncbi:MAG: hypothetical protein ABWY63_14400 [Hyphomicrobiaceae bacterium]